jgi:hypothetical protein
VPGTLPKARRISVPVRFDLLKLDASGVAAALPVLDGDSGTGIADVFYLVVAVSVLGTAVLVPLIIARAPSAWVRHPQDWPSVGVCCGVPSS